MPIKRKGFKIQQIHGVSTLIHTCLVCRVDCSYIMMDVCAPVPAPGMVPGPETVLHSYERLLHGFGKALQQQFHSMHSKWHVCIISRFDGQDAETFPLDQVDQGGQKFDLEAQFRELRDDIDAKLKQRNSADHVTSMAFGSFFGTTLQFPVLASFDLSTQHVFPCT